MRYVLIGPDQQEVKRSDEYPSFLPSVPVKEGYRWIPEAEEVVGTATSFTTAIVERIVEADRVVVRTTHTAIAVEQQKLAVKGEARRRIIARFPDWKQTNMVARALELTRKGAGLTPEEQTEATQLQAAWDWIKAVRAASDALEAMDPIPADFTADQRWPA